STAVDGCVRDPFLAQVLDGPADQDLQGMFGVEVVVGAPTVVDTGGQEGGVFARAVHEYSLGGTPGPDELLTGGRAPGNGGWAPQCVDGQSRVGEHVLDLGRVKVRSAERRAGEGWRRQWYRAA